MKFGVLFGGAAAVLLTACGGSGGGDTTGPNAFAFSDIANGVQDFSDLTDAAVAQSPTSANNLPSGSATYDGLMTVVLDNGTADGVLGTVRLNVGFDNNALTGSAGSFRNFNDEATNGSLSISNGTISPAGVAAGTAQVAGTIDFEAGPMTIDETYTHSFSGDDGQYSIGAAIGGTAQPSVGSPISIITSWVAERQ